MQFIYKPEGAEPRRWDYRPGKMMNPEMEAIERFTGWTFAEWMDKVGKSSILALHGLLYVLLKRDNPTLKWDAVQFTLDEVELEMEQDELRESIDRLEGKGELTADEEMVLSYFRDKLAESDAEAPKDLPVSSDPASDDDTSTPQLSRIS